MAHAACEKFTLPSLPYLTHALHLCTSFSMLQDDEYYLYAAKAVMRTSFLFILGMSVDVSCHLLDVGAWCFWTLLHGTTHARSDPKTKKQDVQCGEHTVTDPLDPRPPRAHPRDPRACRPRSPESVGSPGDTRSPGAHKSRPPRALPSQASSSLYRRAISVMKPTSAAGSKPSSASPSSKKGSKSPTPTIHARGAAEMQTAAAPPTVSAAHRKALAALARAQGTARRPRRGTRTSWGRRAGGERTPGRAAEPRDLEGWVSAVFPPPPPAVVTARAAHSTSSG